MCVHLCVCACVVHVCVAVVVFKIDAWVRCVCYFFLHFFQISLTTTIRLNTGGIVILSGCQMSNGTVVFLVDLKIGLVLLASSQQAL